MLGMDVLRLLTWKALKDRTWAGDRVFDSPSTPADIRVAEEREPFIAVYVDDGDFMLDEVDETGMMAGDANVRLIIEVCVASPRASADPASEDVPDMGGVSSINATDPALEIQMGFIARQAEQALLSTAVTSPWSEIWRAFVIKTRKVEVRRGGPGKESVNAPRFASRLIILHCDIVADPVRGDDLSLHPVWRTIIEAADGDEHLGGIADLLRAHIEKPGGPLPEWRRDQKWMQTTKRTMKDIGAGPAEGFDETTGVEEPAELTEVQTDDSSFDPDAIPD